MRMKKQLFMQVLKCVCERKDNKKNQIYRKKDFNKTCFYINALKR